MIGILPDCVSFEFIKNAPKKPKIKKLKIPGFKTGDLVEIPYTEAADPELETFSFTYTEGFDGMTKAVAQNTVHVVKEILKQLPFKAKFRHDLLTNDGGEDRHVFSIISPKVSKTMVGDMLTGEFMMWGHLGNMTFRDLFVTVMVSKLVPGKMPNESPEAFVDPLTIKPGHA